jgi:hypothetical protein
VLLAVRKRAYDRAVEDFDKVLVIEPDNVEALVSRGDAFGQLGDPALALALNDPNRGLARATLPARATRRQHSRSIRKSPMTFRSMG